MTRKMWRIFVMKKYWSKIRSVTFACALSLIIYLATYWITSAWMNQTAEPLHLVALGIYSLVFMIAFDLVLIYIVYVRNSVGEDDAVRDFQNGYWGINTEIKYLFKRELLTLIVFALINGASWMLISIDKLIFSKRTITAILLIYAPLNIVGVALPAWANGILGYLLGTILCFVIYLLELVIFRKKWYKRWNKTKGGE